MTDAPGGSGRKILFFATTSQIGGTERSFMSLASGFQSRGWDVHLGSLESGGPLREQAEAAGLRFFSPDFKGFHSPGAWFRLRRTLKQQRFDAVLAAGLRGKLYVLPLAAALGVPVRLSAVRGLDPWKKPWHVVLEKALQRCTTAWIANSAAARERTVEREGAPALRVHVLHQGLPVPAEVDASRAARERRPGRFTVGVLANVRRGKGHAFLLRALKPLLDREPGLYVEFMGKDYSSGRIPKLIRSLGLESRVTLTGFVDDIASRLTSRIDLMVLPSFSESFPTSLIEGMLLGVPVAATAVGGVPELLRHRETGWLVEPGDEEGIRHGVQLLMQDGELRARLASAALEDARDRFDAHQAAVRYESLVNSYLEGALGRTTS